MQQKILRTQMRSFCEVTKNTLNYIEFYENKVFGDIIEFFFYNTVIQLSMLQKSYGKSDAQKTNFLLLMRLSHSQRTSQFNRLLIRVQYHRSVCLVVKTKFSESKM